MTYKLNKELTREDLIDTVWNFPNEQASEIFQKEAFKLKIEWDMGTGILSLKHIEIFANDEYEIARMWSGSRDNLKEMKFEDYFEEDTTTLIPNRDKEREIISNKLIEEDKTSSVRDFNFVKRKVKEETFKWQPEFLGKEVVDEVGKAGTFISRSDSPCFTVEFKNGNRLNAGIESPMGQGWKLKEKSSLQKRIDEAETTIKILETQYGSFIVDEAIKQVRKRK